MPPPTNSLLRFTYLPISLLHLLSFHRMNSVLLLALERTCLTAPESLERSSSTWDMYVSQNLTQISSTDNVKEIMLILVLVPHMICVSTCIGVTTVLTTWVCTVEPL